MDDINSAKIILRIFFQSSNYKLAIYLIIGYLQYF